MEDYIIREIDRIGEMLLLIARRLGLFLEDVPDYSLTDVQEEFAKASLPFDLDAVMQQESPIVYLIETVGLSDQCLETFIDILFHSDIKEDRKKTLLNDALTYLDAKGNFSFRLHSLSE